ncbi:uncharacterized protein LOC112690837 [Sipha flava]|uniref:Uncharacterized protein LOC112690837 n=1 Tax=Sipha flava TaxID=143950 RepID=A0A8B8GDG2_9HEMI|nr:uncharacterized protein LOC112690837 [Sipha flava]
MNNMEASCICTVVGHLKVKKLMYTTKKCSLCEKKVFFNALRMVKCIACNRVMHKKCFTKAKNRLVRAPSGGIVVNQPLNKNTTTLATLDQSGQTIVVAPTHKVGNRGQDPVLITKLSWLWNTNNSAVFRMKVELKLPGKYYVEYYKLDIRKELWNDMLMDMMPIEETYGLRRGNGDRIGKGKRFMKQSL